MSTGVTQPSTTSPVLATSPSPALSVSRKRSNPQVGLYEALIKDRYALARRLRAGGDLAGEEEQLAIAARYAYTLRSLAQYTSQRG